MTLCQLLCLFASEVKFQVTMVTFCKCVVIFQKVPHFLRWHFEKVLAINKMYSRKASTFASDLQLAMWERQIFTYYRRISHNLEESF